MKGIILAGGKGTRLQPATLVMNKHMVPILNRPMILYPLETLAKVCSDILIVSGGNHIGAFAEFLGDGSRFGVNLTYKVQTEAGGIAQALGLAQSFVGADNMAVILGDNVFEDLTDETVESAKATIFVKEVSDPYRFGVAEFDAGMKVIGIEEKPEFPKSNFAVTGLYVYPNSVFDIIKTLRPSGRGELEITDVNNAYLERGELNCHILNGFWSDAGTPESLYNVNKWVFNNLKA